MKKENARPSNAESSAPNSLNSSVTAKFTARQFRLLEALYFRDKWISREEADRIAGASNGPQIVMELRRKLLGDDGIETRFIDAIDRDGKPCKPGQYLLTEKGRQIIEALGLFEVHAHV